MLRSWNWQNRIYHLSGSWLSIVISVKITCCQRGTDKVMFSKYFLYLLLVTSFLLVRSWNLFLYWIKSLSQSMYTSFNFILSKQLNITNWNINNNITNFNHLLIFNFFKSVIIIFINAPIFLNRFYAYL